MSYKPEIFSFLSSLTETYVGVNGESHNAPKIPTILNYEGSKLTWGASVDPLAENVVGVKLLLDPSQEMPLYLPTGNIKNDLRKLPKAPVDVAADFISAIYQYALKEISAQVPESYMKMCQKQFVISGASISSAGCSGHDTHIDASPGKLVRLCKEYDPTGTLLKPFEHRNGLI